MYPDFTQFKQLAKSNNLIPVYKEMLADTETPVSAFLKITDGVKEKYAYLLESVERGEKLGRYSFLASQPSIIFESNGNKVRIRNMLTGEQNTIESSDPLIELKRLLSRYQPVSLPGLPRFWGGAVGYISYDYVRFIEKLPKLKPDDLSLVDCLFLFTDNLVIFDHISQTVKVLACVFLDSGNIKRKYEEACNKIENLVTKLNRPLPKVSSLRVGGKQSSNFSCNFAKRDFIQAVKIAKRYICEGEIIQVVLSQRFEKGITTHPFSIYRQLRTVNPSPYMFFLNLDRVSLVGSSPEILVRKEGKISEVRPIAGTRPRGDNENKDKQLEKNLLESPKERAEHIMLVDLGRNDLGRVCEYDTIKIPELMVTEKYSHVMHLVSSVIGKLKKGEDAFSLFRACFPAGTVTGAPKIRAMEIIDELEPVCRGPYAGAVGYFSFQGNMDMAITIRTIVVKENCAYIQAGAGIVADSSADREYQETRNKAAALFTAINLAEQKE